MCTLRLLILHNIVGDWCTGVVHVAIVRRWRPGQQNWPAALLGHVEITWELGRLLHEQVDCCLVLTVGVRGCTDVVAAVHVARLDDPQLGGDASRCVRCIVHRVPVSGEPPRWAVTWLIDMRVGRDDCEIFQTLYFKAKLYISNAKLHFI